MGLKAARQPVSNSTLTAPVRLPPSAPTTSSRPPPSAHPSPSPSACDEAESLGQASRPDIEVDVIRRRRGPEGKRGVGDSRCARGRDGTGVQGFNEELFDRSFCDGLAAGMGVGTPDLAVGLIADPASAGGRPGPDPAPSSWISGFACTGDEGSSQGRWTLRPDQLRCGCLHRQR